MSKEIKRSKKSDSNVLPNNKLKKQHIKWADLTEEQKRENQIRYFSMLVNYFKTK